MARPAPANPVREFIPSSRPGSRLPHGWMEADGRRISTLDLIALDRFTMLVGAAGSAWIEAARDLRTPIVALRIGRDVGDPDDWWTSVAQMEQDGALLVRPDQHVAFRSRGAVPNPCAKLREVASSILAG